MADKKTRRIKRVTEIPEAKVTIEVEENEDSAEEREAHRVPSKDSKPQEEQESSGETEAAEDKGSSSGLLSWKKVFLIILIVVPIGFLMFGGFLFFSKDFNFDFIGKKPEKSIKLPQNSPTPTKMEVDREAHEILVLNGSGIPGEAASVQVLLEGEGFAVGSIGNAESSDYTTTEISATDDIDKEFLDELKEALETRGPTEIVEAPADQAEEVIVTVGSLLADPTPTPVLE